MGRRVTFSRNVTLSLSRTCSCYCKYCAFATHQAHLIAPQDVLALLDNAAQRSIKELLVLTGEQPDQHAGVRELLAAHGHADFVSYVVWACQEALQRGILPHVNIGAITPEQMGRLRAVSASQGLMLESIAERLMQGAHAGSPAKHPSVRLAAIEAAGSLRIPFTTGILVGIGESAQERTDSLAAIAASHARYGHIQEVILQNFVPHPRYHGQDIARLAGSASEQLWRTGIAPPEAPAAVPAWAGGGAGGSGEAVGIAEMKRLIALCRELMPDVGIQVPPNLADWWPELLAAGASDLGGLSANGDHISPEQPFPSPQQVRRRLRADRRALSERLCVYPQYINSEWLSPPVLDVIRQRYWSFIPRDGALRRQAPFAIAPGLVGPALERAADGQRLQLPELTALFAERRLEVIEQIRIAADELRRSLAGETVTFVVNRNINVSNVCTVGCAFCGFGQSRRSPEAYELSVAQLRERVHEALDYGATEICMQSGIHPRWTLTDYLRWLEVVKSAARERGGDIHLHAYSPMEVAHICELSELEPSEVFARLIGAGLGSTPGTAAEILEEGVRRLISPNKLPSGRWVQIIEAAHAAGVPTTATVMFGHIEEPWELARHMLTVRDLQERSGGITEFVPLSFIPYQTLLGRRRGVAEISEAENLKHTAVFRLALGTSVRNLQASWVKMGLAAATEALHWGVNDLGGTLMEESISRMAGSEHGVRLDPEELIGAAHAAGRPAAERSTLYSIRREHPLAEVPVEPLAV